MGVGELIMGGTVARGDEPAERRKVGQQKHHTMEWPLVAASPAVAVGVDERMGAAGSNTACMNGAICCSDNADRFVSKFGEKWKSPKPAGFEEWTESIQQNRRGAAPVRGRDPGANQPPAMQRHVLYTTAGSHSPSSRGADGRKVYDTLSTPPPKLLSPPSTPKWEQPSSAHERSFSNPLLTPVDDILGAMKGVATMRTPPSERSFKQETQTESLSRVSTPAGSTGRQQEKVQLNVPSPPATFTVAASPGTPSRGRQVYESLTQKVDESIKAAPVQSSTTPKSTPAVSARFYWGNDSAGTTVGSLNGPSRVSKVFSSEKRESVEKLLKMGKSDQAVKNHYTIIDAELTLEDIAQIRREWEKEQQSLQPGEDENGWLHTRRTPSSPRPEEKSPGRLLGGEWETNGTMELEREEKEMAMKRLRTLLASQS
ncbi:hypothetical protein GUITHDRAFT_141737 [Guillardia theta CCMP2712]|uniref:Uncharacterized protein n=1 Tax=Guillardia theta (strain CCMP2712) TaxID=905079 RepID=L1IZN5_GUITC|nr:hypothetical protein GUITHDRAFT_141737 [Guillardia theta CCMP2712]EKX41738.1 hypothetical protein GUITHDRAFT_141737 [Guillardia theta CCMP2712]|eukprot:XP_005828718.1 hypothetical protein GUITHDRAFT_141737 [Guillardia theta CCMP2712]